MTQALEIVQDQTADSEDRFYNFDFKNFDEIVAGATLVSVLQVAQAPAGPGGAAPAPTPLTIGSPLISGTKVQVEITGGTPGTSYLLWCRCLTSLGTVKLICRGILNVVN